VATWPGGQQRRPGPHVRGGVVDVLVSRPHRWGLSRDPRRSPGLSPDRETQ
jgi:hypothetical protein